MMERSGMSIQMDEMEQSLGTDPAANMPLLPITTLPPGMSTLPPGMSTLPPFPPGMSTLPAGLSTLPAGLSTLPAGLSTLPVGLSTLHAGLSTLPAGLTTLPAGLSTLPAGLGTLPAGLSTLPAGLSTLPASLGTFPAGLSTLTAGLSTLPAGLSPLPVGMNTMPHGMSTPTTPTSMLLPPQRRSSTRSIKRKKFDDELVESSLTKTERARHPKFSTTSSITSTGSAPGTPITPIPTTVPPLTLSLDIKPILGLPPDPVPTTVAPVVPPTPPIVATIPTPVTVTTVLPKTSTPTVTMVTVADVTPPIITTPPVVADKKKAKSSSKRTKKPKVSSKPPPAGSTKDLGRWKPQDDLLLINAVQQTCDLTAVFHGVKFSCKFTLKEIQERWYALMYDGVLSKLAVQAMKQIHPDVVADINSKALYSKDEEVILKRITSTSQPTLETFNDCLTKNSNVFHPGRTTKALQNHWLLMKQYHLLPDQSVPPMPKGDHVLNFSDAEDMINDEDLRDPKDELLEHELMIADRRQKREIRHVEQELPKWQVLVDSVTGISPPDFDNQTLAVLRGRLVRYLMRSREITLGRATKDNQIDVDLSLEGPAWKISRKQGMIKLKNNGEFYIANEGKRPIYIDSKPVLMGSKQKLNNNSVVEISCLRFIFLINQDLINVIRQEAQIKS